MTTFPERGPHRRAPLAALTTGLGVLSVIGVAALAGPATAAAAGHPTGGSACAQAKHRFVDAKHATVKGKVIEVTGHKAKFHCGGEDDGHYTTSKATETLRISSKATITVFKSEDDPSDTRTIKATALPHWLKKNAAESIYRISGPKTKITSMTEQFHP
jgi:hypothetical protein